MQTQLKDYDLIAFDMDGTLLNSQKTVSEKTCQAIHTAFARGKHIVFATGRCMPEMTEYYRLLPDIRYALLANGAMVYDIGKQKALFTRFIPADIVRSVLDIVLLEDVMPQIVFADRVCVEEPYLDRLDDYSMLPYRPMFLRIMTRVDDIMAYSRAHADGVMKMNLYHRTPEARQRTLERVRNLPLAWAFSEKTSLEINALNVNKGEGLKQLCQALAIPAEKCIAVGDGGNDIAMLKSAGLPLAMGNAADDIKALCQFVLPDNDHDGCAAAIREYLLNNI